MKLWQKDCKLNKKIECFTVGDDYILDKKLVKYDCIASIAHAKMLCKIKILTKEEYKDIVKVLHKIIKLDKKGEFNIKKEDEDCHTAIENYLTGKLGKTGKKIHTARSRNDQVVVALRLYYKDKIKDILDLVDSFIEGLKGFEKRYGSVKIPGYTHMRKAMPSSMGLWVDSFIESMLDNKKLLKSSYDLIDQCPLGSAAGYGVPLSVDKSFTADDLGFKKVQNNSLYVQNSRGKFESVIVDSLSCILFDLNKLASDILLFSMYEFGFFVLDESVCTGSSIMPHKKNADVLELVRAQYHVVLSLEFQIKQVVGNLISGYNRDVQLTKKAVMESIEISKSCLEVMRIVLDSLKVNEDKCLDAITDDMYSVEQIFEYVGKGMSFRDAYRKIAKKY